MFPKRLSALAVCIALTMLLCLPSAGLADIESDFVFLVDASSGMGGEMAMVRTGLAGFAADLAANNVDARYAVVLFGGSPEIVLDFTSSIGAVNAAFASLSTTGGVTGFQRDHSGDPEAGLEAIRVVLGAAATHGGDSAYRTNVGGSGDLAFRTGSRKNLILLTDEDSDSPYYAANRLSGQPGYGGADGYAGDPPTTITGTAWQTEVDNTAQAIIAADAYINMFVDRADWPTRAQYGDPAMSVQNPDFSSYDPNATLNNLVSAGLSNCLEAQVIRAGLVARAFDINDVSQAGVIDNFFDAKVAETIPEPATLALLAVGGLALLRRRTGR